MGYFAKKISKKNINNIEDNNIFKQLWEENTNLEVG